MRSRNRNCDAAGQPSSSVPASSECQPPGKVRARASSLHGGNFRRHLARAGWPVAKVLRGFLFGIGDLDVIGGCVGLLARLGPALRAAKTDPAQTLRAE
ncbi:MAG TPA: hypothetical protein VEX68_29125 [Bryobacteraceae bacterium]|nr:hypothetical protein [Bryobacteraceae bacterium]